MELIDKAALLAEIENLENTYKKCPTRNSYEEGLKDGRLIGYKDALHKLDTLEVKEVDLEKELSTYLEVVKATDEDVDFVDFAKHFFELGMSVRNKVQKGE